ncbi:hypothetical protein PXK56_17955 [Phaeobacter gallaeciensis]|uniref:hypothetical protein n=1 Tax=Phaeobacter gallaeciensis TaxID=60890 RepID=UPI00238055DF|nr:hypothetical protein [Phaeobacter gallaeciensis]MDE4297074.1 hypothetical protein [Phaeobacter gallaeciensis]
MTETPEQIAAAKKNRTFSKRLIVGNIIAAWLILFGSLLTNEVQGLITHVFSFVTVLIGIYTGIGHMDFRKVVEATERASERMKG